MTKTFRPILLGAFALTFSFSAFYTVSRVLIEEHADEKEWKHLFLASDGQRRSNESISEIATRRVCSAALPRRNSYVFDVNHEDIEVRLYSAERTDPQVLVSSRSMLRDLMNEGRLKLDVSEVADGSYQLLLCHKTHNCELPASWKNQMQLQAQLQQYQEELHREFERQERIDFRHYSASFAKDSTAFRNLRSELLTGSHGILGGVPQLTVRAGSIVQPRQSLLVRPHRITTREPLSRNHAAERLTVAPQLIVAWRMEEAHSGRQMTQAPSPDGCFETASLLTVDLQGRGLQVGSVLDGQYQDLYHDGSMQRVAWPTGSHSAFLVWYNADTGSVIPINQLASLRAWDADGNGQLNQKDRLPEQLGLWQDLDQNGTLTAEEWRPFHEIIAAIDLQASRTYVEDKAGNRVEAQARVRLSNGSIRIVAELYPRHF